MDSRRSWGLLSILIALLFVAAAALGVGAFAFNAEASREGPSNERTEIVVARGASVTGIGQQLAREGLIRDARVFRLAHLFYARDKNLQAGEYQIPAHASVREIIDMLAEGDALEHSITFPEGITIAGVMRILRESELLSGEMPPPPPEGAVLPETYHIQRGMTRSALLKEMRDAHDRALAEIWEMRQPGLPVSTPEELVTLASIVERETGVAHERPLVAAVMVNRLRRPMRLEMDSTIIYGVCRQFPGRCRDGRLVDARDQPRVIRASEVALNTGYNTYRIDGLPPTPIANPGRAALEATANPAESNAIFFVADGSGGHAFTATIAEHNAAVARWRVIERERLAAERRN
ncbi:MAG: endolytic transglycosylase MltG [Terricaulis sp.]